MSFKLGKNSKLNRIGVDPKLIEIDDLAITLTKVDYGHGKDAGVRTDKRQNALYLSAKSKADGYHTRGKHQVAKDGLGKALDFYAYVNGEASWQPHYLAMIACAYLKAANILGYKRDVGILWSSTKVTNNVPYGWDGPHITLLED